MNHILRPALQQRHVQRLIRPLASTSRPLRLHASTTTATKNPLPVGTYVMYWSGSAAKSRCTRSGAGRASLSRFSATSVVSSHPPDPHAASARHGSDPHSLPRPGGVDPRRAVRFIAWISRIRGSSLAVWPTADGLAMHSRWRRHPALGTSSAPDTSPEAHELECFGGTSRSPARTRLRLFLNLPARLRPLGESSKQPVGSPLVQVHLLHPVVDRLRRRLLRIRRPPRRTISYLTPELRRVRLVLGTVDKRSGVHSTGATPVVHHSKVGLGGSKPLLGC